MYLKIVSLKKVKTKNRYIWLHNYFNLLSRHLKKYADKSVI